MSAMPAAAETAKSQLGSDWTAGRWLQAAGDRPTYRHIKVKRLSGALGAEIRGVDLAKQEGDPAVMAEIRDALLRYGVVCIRDQGHLDHAAYLRVARQFGESNVYPMLQGVSPEFPNITPISKAEEQTTNFGGAWHSDSSYLPNPPKYTMLLAREMPEVGGDTLFTSMYLAYETLTPAFRRTLDPLRVVQANFATQAIVQQPGALGDFDRSKFNLAAPVHRNAHPLVRQHPETGRRALYTSAVHTEGIEGWGAEEGKALLGFLWAHAIKNEFQCRVQWEVGTLTIWDNRCVMHNAVNDYHGHRRLVHRITIGGDRPRHVCEEAPGYVPALVAEGILGARGKL
ncbi:taurine dioxygenase [Hyaloraphidium curvatum]|nr:taurine dioxygenase [Hyaloraphidium curvatum]